MFIILLFFGVLLIYKNLNKNYNLKRNVFLFLFISFLPLVANIYLNVRVLKIKDINGLKEIKWNAHGRYVLVNDLDFKGYKYRDSYIIEYFSGSFDGRGHKISNLEVPLFNELKYERKSQLQNLYLVDVNINLQENTVGALAKYSSFSISDIHVSGKVKGKDVVGGIVGHSFSITRSSFYGQVEGINSVGGISGSSGSITESFAIGKVIGNAYVGGIVGYSSIDNIVIKDCYTHTDIVGKASVGGIAGTIGRGTISNSIVYGSVTGESRVGAIAFDYIAFPDNNLIIVGKTNLSNYTPENNIYYFKDNYTSNNISQEFAFDILLLGNPDWYLEELGFADNIWDFAPLINKQLPRLKNVSNYIELKIFE